ncbi:MAG: Rid family detoxifying hydrolase [Exilibacterium sp.]
MNKIRIQTNAAAPAIGTYSQALRCGDLVFVAGQTGRDPETGALDQGLEAQTHRTLANIDAILNAAGCTRADLVKVTLMLTDIKNFKAVDQVYAAWLPGHGVTPPKPVRTAFQVAALPAQALVMFEVVAAVPEGKGDGGIKN